MAHPNEDMVRRGYAAFGTGDMATLSELFADDIVWHVGGRSPITGDYKGKGEVFGFLAQLAERAGGTFRSEAHDVLANDEHVVALVEGTAQRDGKTLNDNGVQIFHVQGGKVTEQWFYPGDQYASDDFWS
jgi:ketosteroid isomerase-like protein